MRRALTLGPILLAAALVAWALWDRAPSGTAPPEDPPSAASGLPDLLAATPGLRGAGHAPTQDAATAEDADGPAVQEDAADEDGCTIPLVVETVDALTGRAVRATWHLGDADIRAGPFPPGAVIDEAAVERSRLEVEASIARWRAGFVPTGEPLPARLCLSPNLRRTFTVRAPDGYVVARGETVSYEADLAVGTREARYVLPLWPEAVLDLRVVDETGRPVDAPRVLAAEFAHARRAVVAEPGAPGELRVRGIPRMPGVPLRIWLTWGRGDVAPAPATTAPVEEVVEPEAVEPQVHVAVPPEGGVPWRVEVRVQGDQGPADAGVETDSDLPYEESFGEPDGVQEPMGPTIHLRVQVLGWDGNPVRGAFVVPSPRAEGGMQWTDAEGRATVRCPAGAPVRVDAAAAGRLDVSAKVMPTPDATTDVVLQEPRGARLEVRVVDAEGRPRPSARLELSPARVFDLVDGVQRIDLVTDERGRRTLERVQPGPCAIAAHWGGRLGRAGATLRDGETATVTVVVR